MDVEDAVPIPVKLARVPAQALLVEQKVALAYLGLASFRKHFGARAG